MQKKKYSTQKNERGNRASAVLLILQYEHFQKRNLILSIFSLKFFFSFLFREDFMSFEDFTNFQHLSGFFSFSKIVDYRFF